MSVHILSIGDILKDIKTGKKYRIVSIYNDYVELCEMEIKQFKIAAHIQKSILNLLANGDVSLENDREVIFDKNKLPEKARNEYQRKKRMMNDVIKMYFPTFSKMTGRKAKPELKKIMLSYNIPKNTFWRICTHFFQSGMKEYSLVNARTLGLVIPRCYQYRVKTGKKSKELNAGIIVNDEMEKYFQEALDDYKSGRHKTIHSAFDKMNKLHFSRLEVVNGKMEICLKPVTERPTLWQFYYYVKKHITQEEKDAIKTSAQEQRNNKRLLLSDSLEGVYGPGDMVEIDACEADVSLVSVVDRNKSIGRPIVYFMVDVFTRIILAMSITFDNDSVLGFTNLLLNLCDDKKEYCKHYGLEFDNDAIWPSNIIPRRYRTDRGSEFKSKEVDRICNELGIEKQIVTGGSGSLKGIVEQLFHQMHFAQNVHLEDHGLIEKRYDSQHNKEATIDINQYTKMVINFVLTYNQRYMNNYHLTRDMLEKGVKPVPVLLWKYGVEKYGHPRPIVDEKYFIYHLMTVITARLNRRGISYKDLWYLPDDDSALFREMFEVGNKKIKFEARMDMRDVGRIYYIRDNKLICAPLNTSIKGNADYDGLTMKEYEDYRSLKKRMDAMGSVHNEEISAYRYAINACVVSEAKKESSSEVKDIRPTRKTEKQIVSSKNRMRERLEDGEVRKLSVQSTDYKTNENSEIPSSVSTNNTKYKRYSSWQEALADFESDE